MICSSKLPVILVSVTILALGLNKVCVAYENINAELSNVVGATDFYKITCPESTDHVNFKIKDVSPVIQPAPQFINIHLNKTSFQTVNGNEIKANEQSELYMQGGKGKYQISVDTIGTNPQLTKAQSYNYQYQCLYADKSASAPKTASKKSIKNGSKQKFTVTCSDKPKTRNQPALAAEGINLKVTNLSAPSTISSSSQLLIAQVTKRGKYDPDNIDIYAANASDINGDDAYSEEINVDGGAGDYYLTATNTATTEAVDNAKSYSYQLNCLDNQNNIAGEASVLTLQDQ